LGEKRKKTSGGRPLLGEGGVRTRQKGGEWGQSTSKKKKKVVTKKGRGLRNENEGKKGFGSLQKRKGC